MKTGEKFMIKHVRYWDGVEEKIECNENPDEAKLCCYCIDKCKNFYALKHEAEKRFYSKIEELKNRYKDVGEIVEWGSAYCENCPEKPHECPYCRNSPHFLHLKRPYVKIMVVDEEE